MEYQITLNKEQLKIIAYCLEDISRFASGQPQLEYTINKMLNDVSFDEILDKSEEVKNHLDAIKKILLPNVLDNASLGFNGTEFIGNTYQIYRSILHFIAMEENWNNVYSTPALTSGNLGTIKIKKI
jgi:hypothetical protein